MTDTGVVFKEARALEELFVRVESWRGSAQAAVENSPDLKQLQQLITAGEAFPVEFPTLLEQLQSKLAQAETWVERVRNAVPRQNKTRRTADVEKVCTRHEAFFVFVPQARLTKMCCPCPGSGRVRDDEDSAERGHDDERGHEGA